MCQKAGVDIAKNADIFIRFLFVTQSQIKVQFYVVNSIYFTVDNNLSGNMAPRKKILHDTLSKGAMLYFYSAPLVALFLPRSPLLLS